MGRIYPILLMQKQLRKTVSEATEILDPHMLDSVIYRGNEQGQLSYSMISLNCHQNDKPHRLGPFYRR